METPENVAFWTQSIEFQNSFLIVKDEHLDFAIANSGKHGLPDIQVSASQGKYLYLLAKTTAARNILEIGTLGGYSTLWMAKGLNHNGHIVTCELSPEHAKCAQENFDNADLASKIEIKLGNEVDTVAAMQPAEPFDLVFIDADKQSNLKYYIEAKRMTRPGSIIIVDNVVRQGTVANITNNAPSNVGVRELLEYLRTDTDVEATTIATVDEKGYDGFMYIRKV